MYYCFLATGFEEIEAIATVDMLRRVGINVKTVSVDGDGLTVKGAHGIPVVTDVLIHNVTKEEVEGIILPGGMPGTINLEESAVLSDIIDCCVENDLYIFAICAAPQILGHKGILKGKKATCYPGFEGELEGAEALTLPAVKDGKVITAKGPGATFDFGAMIIEELIDAKTATELKESMQCR